MSNRLFQSVVHQMKDEVNRTIGVVDSEGLIVACSDLIRIGETIEGVREEPFYTGETFFAAGYLFRPIGAHGKTE